MSNLIPDHKANGLEVAVLQMDICDICGEHAEGHVLTVEEFERFEMAEEILAKDEEYCDGARRESLSDLGFVFLCVNCEVES